MGEYLSKIIAKSTSFGRYILQDTRVGKYSRTACMSDQYTVGTREVDVSGGHPPIDYRVK